jgi:hypothetical protein
LSGWCNFGGIPRSGEGASVGAQGRTAMWAFPTRQYTYFLKIITNFFLLSFFYTCSLPKNKTLLVVPEQYYYIREIIEDEMDCISNSNGRDETCMQYFCEKTSTEESNWLI